MKKVKVRKKNRVKDVFKGTTWKIGLTGVVYFLIFTLLLSLGVFTSRLHLELGMPSPQLITAPWDKDIEDLEKYRQDQEAARKAVEPVYKPDVDFVANVAKDLSKVFIALEEGINPAVPEADRLNALRQNPLLAKVSETVLSNLLAVSAGDLAKAQDLANTMILEKIGSVETGAHNDTEVGALRDQMKQELSQSELSEDLKSLIGGVIDLKITRPTLVVDEEATEKKRDEATAGVKLEVYHYKADQKIVGAGDIVDEEILRVLGAYGLVKSSSPWQITGGIAMMVLASLAVLGFYLYQYKRSLLNSPAKLVLIGLAMGLVLLLGKGIATLNIGSSEYNSLVGMLIPVAWATMALAILLDINLALMVTLILSIFVAIMVDPTLSTATAIHAGLVALFSGIAGVFSVSRLSQRSDMARAGLYIAAANVFIISGVAVTSGMRPAVWSVGCLLGIVNGLAASVLTVGTLHWFESAFKITSSMRLLELSNPNRPLLKRLLMEAPGTYHHSVIVGNLAETAAEVIEADAVLVRVGAMYHDIGKLKRPYFFIENQFAQDNPHAKIAPTLSALIITSHVKDGLELAKEYKLPEPVRDIIAQHHGDSVVSFFYHRALEEKEDIPEESFRYDGPKPQTKEAALVCLADSVEAAVRSMKQPTPGRIEGLVRKIIKDRLNNGQLDQCNLTFQDLDRIAMAFVRVLSGIFHSRIEYPELPGKSGQEIKGKKPDGKGGDGSKSSDGKSLEGRNPGGKSLDHRETDGDERQKDFPDSEKEQNLSDIKEEEGR